MNKIEIFSAKNIKVFTTHKHVCIIHTNLDDNHDRKVQLALLESNIPDINMLKFLKDKDIEQDEFISYLPKTAESIETFLLLMKDLSELAMEEDVNNELESMLSNMNINDSKNGI